jgi:hypothetical protein
MKRIRIQAGWANFLKPMPVIKLLKGSAVTPNNNSLNAKIFWNPNSKKLAQMCLATSAANVGGIDSYD